MLIAVCSLKGSPGVTTAAVALAARWPAVLTPVVVECDPAGGDLAARFRLAANPGLVSLAAAARRSGEASVVWQHIQHLAEVAVVVGPPGAEQARAAVGVVASHRGAVLRAAADQPGVVVLADCGRVAPDSAVLPIVRSADAMVLLAHAHADELSHVAAELRMAAGWTRCPALVLVGDGYPTGDVERELGVGVLGRLPRDPKGAAALCGRRTGGPGPDRSALGHAALRVAHGINKAVHRTVSEPALGSPDSRSAPVVGSTANSRVRS